MALSLPPVKPYTVGEMILLPVHTLIFITGWGRTVLRAVLGCHRRSFHLCVTAGPSLSKRSQRAGGCQRKSTLKKAIPILILASFLLAACRAYPSYGMPAPGMRPSYSNNGGGNFASNGERIYFTATDRAGNAIPYTGGAPSGGMMMDGPPACVSCHGPDGRGGVHYMHMQTMDAPPIYYDALVEMMQEESGGTAQPGGYTLEDFRKSVVDGQHPDGDSLDEDMPRWQMNDQDLADLFAFIKTLR